MASLGRFTSKHMKHFHEDINEIRGAGKKHMHNEIIRGKKGHFWSIAPTAVKCP